LQEETAKLVSDPNLLPSECVLAHGTWQQMFGLFTAVGGGPLGRFVVMVAVTLLIVGCDSRVPTAEFDKAPEAQYLRSMVERLAARDYVSVEEQLDRNLRIPNLRNFLEQIAAPLQAGAPTKMEPVALNYRKTESLMDAANNSRVATVAIEYTFPNSKWVVVSATLEGDPGKFRIIALNIDPQQKPLAEANALTFRDKGILHILFAVLTIGAVLVSLFAFFRSVFAADVRNRWVWAIVSLIGVVGVTMNWSTGVVSVVPLHINLLSAALVREGWLGPWSITVCLPLGAIVFLWEHRKRSSAPTS
jgi:hypothetical protein